MAIVFAALIVFFILNAWHVNEYSITPGDAQPVAQLVSVKGLATDPHHDKILLTDVYLTQLTAWGFLLAHFQPHTEIVSGGDLTLPGVPTDQLVAQGYVDMANSKEYAKVAALESLGWKIPHRDVGATVYAVRVPSTAHTAGLAVGDEIDAVNGYPVANSCDMLRKIGSYPVGDEVTLSVRSAVISPSGTIVLRSAKPVKVATVAVPHDTTLSGCPASSQPLVSMIAVEPVDAVDYTTPGSIKISTPNIGGPSAGLAMTLTLIDQLSSGSLSGGRTVAATGTISPDGTVGDVGGVAEKTIAVERAGATVFIVPSSEVATARGAADASLHVEGVDTLAQALNDLRHLGGEPPIPLTKPSSL